jgi:hypothetical protein
MTTALNRAESLIGLLRDQAPEPSPQPLVEAAVRLCEELVSRGEPSVALSLMAALEPMSESVSPETRVKAVVAKVGVLNSAGRYAEALELAETTESSCAALLRRFPDTAYCLQIHEGASLWLLNRPEEAVRRLTKVREHLLLRPDSQLLADCTVQLASAHAIQGDYGTARYFALDGLVSASRPA